MQTRGEEPVAASASNTAFSALRFVAQPIDELVRDRRSAMRERLEPIARGERADVAGLGAT